MLPIFIWFQEDRISHTGKDARNRELTTYAHACFLIKSMSQRDEHVRNISVNLLTQLRDKFPQVNGYIRSLVQKIIRSFTMFVREKRANIFHLYDEYTTLIEVWRGRVIFSHNNILKASIRRRNYRNKAQNLSNIIKF